MVAFVEELAENNKVYATAIITVIVAGEYTLSVLLYIHSLQQVNSLRTIR